MAPKFVAGSFALMTLFLMFESARVAQFVSSVGVGSSVLSTIGDFGLFVVVRPLEPGYFIANFLLAVGLADQINLLRSDRARLRKEALDAALVSQEKLKSEVERQTLELKESRDRLLKSTRRRLLSSGWSRTSFGLRLRCCSYRLSAWRRKLAKSKVSIWQRNAMRLQRLVNQLLDLQKSEVGRREEPLIRIDVHPFLATAGLFLRKLRRPKVFI